MRLRTFRGRLFSGYLVIVVLPLLLSGGFFLARAGNDQERNSIERIEQNLTLASTNFLNIRRQVETIGMHIFLHAEIRRILTTENEDLYYDVVEHRQLQEIVAHFTAHPSVSNVRVLFPREKLYTRQPPFVALSTESGSAHFDVITQSGPDGWSGRVSLPPPAWQHEYETIVHTVVIRDLLPFRLTYGYVLIEVPTGLFSLENLLSGYGDWACIMDASGHVISEAVSARATESDNSPCTLRNLQGDSPGASITKREIPGINWTVYYGVPRRELRRDIAGVGFFVFSVIFVLCIMGIFLTWFVSNRISAGVHGLVGRMNGLAQQYRDGVTVSANDEGRPSEEIELLEWHFQRMLSQIADLLKRNYQTEIEKGKATFDALQSQINPHFLYNVLDSINWTAIRAGNAEVAKVVAKLGRFYRIALDGGRVIIPFHEEISFTKMYVDLQKFRLGDSLNLTIDVEPDVVNCRVVKMTLQPLVENAIRHGVMLNRDKNGDIRIAAKRLRDDLVIRVCDNGPGIVTQAWENGLPVSSGRKGHGLGLENVRQRLTLHYGTRASLRIYREEERWTVAEVIHPAFDSLHT